MCFEVQLKPAVTFSISWKFVSKQQKHLLIQGGGTGESLLKLKPQVTSN